MYPTIVTDVMFVTIVSAVTTVTNIILINCCNLVVDRVVVVVTAVTLL